MNSAVIVFPGSNCDRDLAVALEQVTGRKPAMVWHRDTELPEGIDFIGIPGGFSYGDYLRSGAMAARSPIMRAVADAAGRGVPVLGVCNGFQVLTETGLLPGALMRNAGLHFVCRPVAPHGREQPEPVHRSGYDNGRGNHDPVAHHDGNYQADAETLDRLEGNGRVALPLSRGGQRLGAQHRRHPQRRRQRARHDAPPRARRSSPRTAAPTAGGCSKGWWRTCSPKRPRGTA